MSDKISTKRIVLHFPRRLVNEPIVCRLVKDYNLDFNILKASVTPKEEGLVVLELNGREDDLKKAEEYLKKTGVRTQPLSKDVVRDDASCTHCGACITVCPVGAFELDAATRKVNFYKEKCIVCELCIKACPPRAMEIKF
ncbi:MAG: NIL domain-containing protein [Candidatus Omnitrophica bacterium]|nr:NIL domain-containing protein [Candidatus Omnitrophota bacterium]